MSILKYIKRLRRIDQLIRLKATGDSTEFAHKIGISRSVLMNNLKEIKELGAPICYDKYRKSYYYEKHKKLVINYVDYEILSEKEKNIKGGKNNCFNAYSFFSSIQNLYKCT